MSYDNRQRPDPIFQILSAVGRIEGKLEGINERLDQREEAHKGLEERVRKGEEQDQVRAGTTRILGVLAGVVSGALAGFLGRHFG